MVSATSRPLLTREQVAARLNIAPQTLAKWACEKSQDLPVIHIGRAVRYRPEDVEAYVAARTTRPGGAE